MAISDLEAAVSSNEATDVRGFELSPEVRAQADLKFTYVVTCQIYGKQKEEQKPEAGDIALLMQRQPLAYAKILFQDVYLHGFLIRLNLPENALDEQSYDI